MSAEGRSKRGAAGLSNAKNIAFRYHGGSYTNPAFLTPETRMARNVGASGSRNKSRYITGLIGGMVFAKMGFTFPGWEK